MDDRIRPDLVIEAYRMSDGGVFITYGGRTQQPELITLALDVAEQIFADFGGEEKEEAEDPFL